MKCSTFNRREPLRFHPALTDEGRVALDREFDQGIEGIEGGILEGLSHEGRHLPDALERRVQV